MVTKVLFWESFNLVLYKERRIFIPRVLFPPLFCLFQSNAIDAQKNIKGPFFWVGKESKVGNCNWDVFVILK